MKYKNRIIAIIIVILIIIPGTTYYLKQAKKREADQAYNVEINPADFSTKITNRYFPLSAGKKFVYEAETADGNERVEITISGDTKEIMGVQTLVYHDKVYLNGQLIEETRDYIAQDKEGNVWYFGEDVDNYENGELKDHKGSWIAGDDGAKPGMWMKAQPREGDIYRQEYYPGEAEDMAEVISTAEIVPTKIRTYQHCVQTYDYTPLETSAKEYKYYCPEVGGLVLEINVTDGERLELVEVRNAN